MKLDRVTNSRINLGTIRGNLKANLELKANLLVHWFTHYYGRLRYTSFVEVDTSHGPYIAAVDTVTRMYDQIPRDFVVMAPTSLDTMSHSSKQAK